MAFLEGKLQPIDLLSALQSRRQMEQSAEDERRKSIQNQLMEQQLKEKQTAMSLILGQGGPPTVDMYSAYSPGLSEYRQRQDSDKKISQLTGQPLPNQGIVGGGGGRGGWGGGEPSHEPTAPGSNYTASQGAELNAINDWQPQQAKPDSTTIASELAKLYQTAPQADNLGGGSMKDSTTGTYKEFSQNQTNPAGRYVDASGGETTTGLSAAADYQSGLAGKDEVEKILKEREMAPGKQAAAKAQVLNNAAKSISGDPRFAGLDDTVKQKILNNIGTIVEDNIKTKGTPIIEVGEVIAKYGK